MYLLVVMDNILLWYQLQYLHFLLPMVILLIRSNNLNHHLNELQHMVMDIHDSIKYKEFNFWTEVCMCKAKFFNFQMLCAIPQNTIVSWILCCTLINQKILAFFLFQDHNLWKILNEFGSGIRSYQIIYWFETNNECINFSIHYEAVFNN